MPSLLRKDQKKYFQELISRAQGELGKPPPPIETQLPGIDPLTQQTIEEGMQYGQGELGQQRLSAIMNQLQGGDPYQGQSPEFIRQQLADLYINPAMRAFSQDIAPQIEAQYAGTGAYRSGDISRAISEASEGVGVGAAQALAGLTENELQRAFLSGQNAMTRQQQAIPLAEEEEKTPLRFGLMAGDIRRGIGVEQSQFDLMKELRNSEWANPALGLAPLLLAQYKVPSAGGGGSFLGNLAGSLINPAGKLLGGMMGGGGGAGMF